MGFLLFYLFSVVFCWLAMVYSIRYDLSQKKTIPRSDLLKGIFLMLLPFINLLCGFAFFLMTFLEKNEDRSLLDKLLLGFFLAKRRKKDD